MVYGEIFLRNFKFYVKTLTKLHDVTVLEEATINPKSPKIYYQYGSFFSVADPGSGMGKNQDPDPGSGSEKNILDRISERLETIFCVKILEFFDLESL